jgi:hypothetical protein
MCIVCKFTQAQNGNYPENVIDSSIALMDPTNSGVIRITEFFNTFQKKKERPTRRSRHLQRVRGSGERERERGSETGRGREGGRERECVCERESMCVCVCVFVCVVSNLRIFRW